jgi:hypothetical protein
VAITTFTNKEFEQGIGKAKKATKNGPVFITEQRSLAYVLLSIEEYSRLTRKGRSLAESLAMPGIEEIDFEPPRVGDEFPVPPDLS